MVHIQNKRKKRWTGSMKFFWIVVIDFQTWITFAIASEFILLIPGPTILLVVEYSLSHGKTATFPLVTGVGLGDFTAMVFSFTGLGLLLNQASELFTLFKWVGALYLIYLGIQLWRMPVESTDWSDDTPMSQSPRECCGMHGSPPRSTRKALFFSWPFCPSLSIPNQIF